MIVWPAHSLRRVGARSQALDAVSARGKDAQRVTRTRRAGLRSEGTQLDVYWAKCRVWVRYPLLGYGARAVVQRVLLAGMQGVRLQQQWATMGWVDLRDGRECCGYE